jgi:hypothetical protein
MTVSLQRSAFLKAIQEHDPSSFAVVENESGLSFSYGSLLNSVAQAKQLLLIKTGKSEESISGERIALMVESGFEFVGVYQDPGIANYTLELSEIYSEPHSYSRCQRYCSAISSVFPRARVEIYS